MPIRKVLIANRGEIVVRVARTLRELGIRSVAVYSEVDRDAPHVGACDDAVAIGPAAATESYLKVEALLDAARRTKADAVHPGYGFLSERPAFAEAVTAAGLTWIGPPAAAMRAIGDKGAARTLAERAKVPTVPGTAALADDAAVREAALRIGLPVMLKAAAGGGGKGTRRLTDLATVAADVAATRREAEAAFGDGRILVEKLIAPARHVEVQVVADAHGGVVALGERDCSLQRRFQKIVEEAPSPAVDAALRTRLCEAASRLALAAGYRNAGTVEFLLGPDGQFYFLEVNARLQVEHPVTEAVTGVDLVRMQVEVADGGRVPAAAPSPRGHAIEARLYAEQPELGFLPGTGRILRLAFPGGVRVDHALREGLTITPHYDPLLAKVVAWAPDREHARRRLVTALRDTVLLGVPTNLTWLAGLVDHPDFAASRVHTAALPDVRVPDPPPALFAAALLAGAAAPVEAAGPSEIPTPWRTLGRWRHGE